MTGGTPARRQFLQLKAFGDFVIALTALERAAATGAERAFVLAGNHLRPLCAALAPTIDVAFLATGEAGVPALFDVKRAGLFRALRSGITLRRAVAGSQQQDAVLVLDRDRWRERWVGGWQAEALPYSDNIYDAYRQLLEPLCDTPTLDPPTLSTGSVGIFPGSRIAAKNLPEALVRHLLAQRGPGNGAARLFLLDGERPDLAASDLLHTILPRRFEALVEAIDSVDRVVSADSLPAHLAERASRPVFVLSPRPNQFWLPASSFRFRRWSTFDIAQDDGALAEFVGTGTRD